MLATVARVVALGWLTAVSEASFANSYERHLQPAPLPEQSRALAKVVRAFAARHGLILRYDPRLMGAATCQLRTLLKAPADASLHVADETLSLEPIRRCARDLGWTDGTLCVAQVTSRQKALPQALAYELERTLGQCDATAMGLATTTHEAGRATVVVALSRRLLRLSPVPQQRPTGSRVVLTGTVAQPKIVKVIASMQCPNGQVVTWPLAFSRGHFMGVATVGTTPGVLHVELLVERGAGPEVASTFPITIVDGGLEAQPGLTTARAQSPSMSQPLPQSAQAPSVADLLALVWGIRTSHGLPLPTLNQNLMAAAQNHAQDMAKKHFFAHVSPTTGDVTQRLYALGEPYQHVVENIAADHDVPAAFTQWLESPGHLANLLDPKVTQVGVGLAPSDEAMPQWLTVLVMTRPSP